jgi:tensin
VEATKNVVDETRKVVEKEQSRLFAVGPVRRDPRLPLDVDALRDAEVVYITERIITMSHPAMQSQVDEKITPNRKLAAVAHLLDRRHGGRYMIWNLSEVEYDIDMFDDQVLTFSFPGSPSPPLGLLLKLLMSMESWLKADERNVAVVHCLTGKGRTSTVLAAFLCWVGEAGFDNVQEALSYIAKCKKLSEDQLTIPSQRRYVKYFANMLDGVRPSQPPLMLKRVIMSEAPKVCIVIMCLASATYIVNFS